MLQAASARRSDERQETDCGLTLADHDVADVEDGALLEPQDVEDEDGFDAFDAGAPTVVVVVLERLAVGLE